MPRMDGNKEVGPGEGRSISSARSSGGSGLVSRYVEPQRRWFQAPSRLS